MVGHPGQICAGFPSFPSNFHEVSVIYKTCYPSPCLKSKQEPRAGNGEKLLRRVTWGSSRACRKEHWVGAVKPGSVHRLLSLQGSDCCYIWAFPPRLLQKWSSNLPIIIITQGTLQNTSSDSVGLGAEGRNLTFKKYFQNFKGSDG